MSEPAAVSERKNLVAATVVVGRMEWRITMIRSRRRLQTKAIRRLGLKMECRKLGLRRECRTLGRKPELRTFCGEEGLRCVIGEEEGEGGCVIGGEGCDDCFLRVEEGEGEEGVKWTICTTWHVSRTKSCKTFRTPYHRSYFISIVC